jgi:hypothetical protein
MPRIAIPTEAVGRIVKSVGPNVTLVQINDYVVGPPDPNKDLSYRLHQSLRWYYLAREGRSDADKKLQVRKLLGILKTGSKLLDLLKSPQSWDWLKEFEFERVAYELEHALPTARSLIHELELKIKYGDDYATEYLAGRDSLRDLIRKRSPFEWLVGAYLADDYRICFGREPTLQRGTDGQLGGPYIRFVEQVLVEFDVKNGRRPFGREAIAKALTNVRKGRYRSQAPSA